MSVQIFSTRECQRCKKLGAFLEKNGIDFEYLMLDDPEHKTDSIMYNIMTVPAILKGEEVLYISSIFSDVPNAILDEKRVLEFVKSA